MIEPVRGIPVSGEPIPVDNVINDMTRPNLEDPSNHEILFEQAQDASTRLEQTTRKKKTNGGD